MSFLLLISLATILFPATVATNEVTIVNTFCSSDNTITAPSFNFSTIVNFRTIDFPKSLPSDNSSALCQMHFESSSTKFPLFMAFYSGNSSDIIIYGKDKKTLDKKPMHVSPKTGLSPFYVISDKLTGEYYGKTSQWNAFEAVAVLFNENASCPLSHKTITLQKDVTVPIAFDSTFSKSKSAPKCSWKLKTTSPNQQLKFIFYSLAACAENCTFTLKKDGKVLEDFFGLFRPHGLITKNPEDTFQAFYYDSDDKEEFELEFENLEEPDTAGFFAFASVVEKLPEMKAEPCKVEKHGDVTSVYNLDYKKGYDANEICEYKITIPKNHEVIMNVETYLIEEDVDRLVLYHGENETIVRNQKTYKFTHEADGTILRFTSDGNTQFAGFNVTFETFECKCPESEIILPCKNDGVAEVVKNYRYCSDQRCKVTVVQNKECPSKYFELEILAFPPMATVSLYTQDKLREAIHNELFYRPFKTDNKVAIEIASKPAAGPLTHDHRDFAWSIRVVPVEAKNLTHNPKLEGNF